VTIVVELKVVKGSGMLRLEDKSILPQQEADEFKTNGKNEAITYLLLLPEQPSRPILQKAGTPLHTVME
jgi:hypothetical protein